MASTAARYEAVAATRPRIRRDVLFTETPEGVLFHNADGGFQLAARSAYRFATLLVPHLNGEHSVADICEGFGDKQRAMVGELVQTLYERDFARDVPVRRPGAANVPSAEAARRYAPQIAYIDHYADDADSRFQRFRTARVAVLGDDLVARWCALSLVRNGGGTIGLLPGQDTREIAEEAEEARADGCPVELLTLGAEPGGNDAPAREPGWADLESYDIVVVTGGPEAPRRIFPLLRAGIPEGRTLLPAWSYGGSTVVGPLMEPGSTGCWTCAALRLGANGGVAEAADLWSGLALPRAVRTGARPDRPLAAMIGNLLGYEVFRVTTGALPAETAGQLVIQDTESLDVTAEPLLPHPGCPSCAVADKAGAGEGAGAAAADLAAAGLDALPMPTVATAREADALVEELNRRSALVRPRAGVFTRFADEPLTQIPLKTGTVELGIGHAGTRRIAAFDVHHVAGARLRALNAAAGVYAEHVVPPARTVAGDRLKAALDRLPAITPDRLTTVSGTGVPAEALPLWTTATSLLTKEKALVPAAAVRTFGPDNAGRAFEATTAGTGAGASLADAAARGLLSALAHDALIRAVRGTAAARVPLEDTEDAELTFLVRSAANLGVEVELLDLGETAAGRSGAHVLLARTDDDWAIGGELTRQTAAVAALRDLLGRVQLARDPEGTGAPVDTGDPLLRDFHAGTLTVTEAWAPVPDDAATAWPDVLERLDAAGRDAFVLPTGSADLATAGIHTARVLLTTEPARGE